MPEVVFHVDQPKSMREQEIPGHNRWHTDIPSVAFVRPGTEFPGTDQRDRGRPQRLLLAVPADSDLRLRHPAHHRGPETSRPGTGRHDFVKQ